LEVQIIDEEMFAKMTEAYRRPYLDLSVVDFNKLPSESIVLFYHFLDHAQFYKLMLNPATDYNFREKLTKTLDQLFRSDFELTRPLG